MCVCARARTRRSHAGNTTTPGRILAEDFLGTFNRLDSKEPGLGSVERYNKTEALQDTSPTCESNELVEVTLVFEGDSVVFAFGKEQWVDLAGVAGSYTWTDVWVVRDDRWVIRTADDFSASREVAAGPPAGE